MSAIWTASSGHAFPGQPEEEVVGGAAVVLYGRRRTRPRSWRSHFSKIATTRRDGDGAHVRVRRAIPRSAAIRIPRLTKRVLALGDADRVAPACLRLRPDCGHGLDLRKAHSAAFFQLQKAHQAQLIIGAFPQGRSSGACLPEMNEISFPLLNKWRCSISLSGSGKEDFFKHTCASMLVEAQESAPGAVMIVMLCRSRPIICGKSTHPAARAGCAVPLAARRGRMLAGPR